MRTDQRNFYSAKAEKALEDLSDFQLQMIGAAFVTMAFCESNRQEFFDLGVGMALGLEDGEMIFRASLPGGDCVYGTARSEDAFIAAIERVVKPDPDAPVAHYVVYDGRYVNKDKLAEALRELFGSRPFWVTRSPGAAKKVLFFQKVATNTPVTSFDAPVVKVRDLLSGEDDYDSGEEATENLLEAKWSKMTVKEFIDSLKARRWDRR
jgi:hypothetical protein